MSNPDYDNLNREELLEELEKLRQNSGDSAQSVGASVGEAGGTTAAHYRALVEGSSDLIYILDKEGVFTFANKESERLLGYTPEEIVGRHFSEVLHSQDLDAVGRSFHERRTGDRATRRLEVRLNTSGGTTRDVEIDMRHFALSASGLYDGDDFIGTHGVARDVTERKYYDSRYKALQKVRERVWTMVNSDDLQHVLDGIRLGLETVRIPFHHCSINVLDMSDPPMMYTYSSFGTDAISKQGEWMVSDADQFTVSTAEIWRRNETAYRRDLKVEDLYSERDSMSELYGSVSSIVDVPFSHGTLSVNSTEADAFSDQDIEFLQDLAEVLAEGFRRVDDLEQMAQSENRYRTLVETPNFVVLLLDAEGNYLYVSPQIENWLGYTAEEFYLDADLSRQIIHPEDLTTTAAFHQIEPGSSLRQVEYRWRKKSGEYRWASGSIFPIYEDPDDELINKLSMVQVVVQDITERKIGEEQIRAQLEEKEVLLKEIHHRVKNNLQIISSLLHLQSRQVEDESVLAIFNDSQHRVRSMALIHEELYKSEDLANIDFVGYLNSLTHNLMQSYGVDENRIELRTHVKDVYFGIDTAVPLGLIVNELVSNAIKHAFPADRAGVIDISLDADEEEKFRLSVTDDGVGIPADMDLKNPSSLGLKLVSTLASQLRSQVTMDGDSGTRFTIERQ